MSDVLGTSADNDLIDEVAASMQERVLDVWRAQRCWPFPKWVDGKIVKLRIVEPPFNIQECEEAPF